MKTLVFALLATFTLQGCNSGDSFLQGIDLEPGQTLALDTPIKFVLRGTGTCLAVTIDWGDGGLPETYTYPNGIRLSGTTASDIATRTVPHSFSGWGGGKTVTAEAARGCKSAKVNLRFNVPPFERQIALAQPGTAAGTNMCKQPAPPLPAMMPRMLVHIQTNALERPNDRGINFGCFAAGCVYDADGKPGTVAASPFPFPGQREYSLVLRIGSPLGSGSQTYQGGTNTQFTTTNSGPLEFCLNDGDVDLTNNRGGYVIRVSVDQLGPSS
ncbi:MAG: hypothetical protein ABI665_22830 [Vicinamibacterales bacterium]